MFTVSYGKDNPNERHFSQKEIELIEKCCKAGEEMLKLSGVNGVTLSSTVMMEFIKKQEIKEKN